MVGLLPFLRLRRDEEIDRSGGHLGFDHRVVEQSPVITSGVGGWGNEEGEENEGRG